MVRHSLEQLVGLRVIHRDRVDVDRRLAARRALAIDRRERLVDDREGLEPQEVELDEADRLEVVLIELRQHAALRGIQRHELRERLRRNHHAARMRADVAREPLEPSREVDEPANFLFLLVHRAQLGIVRERFVERDADLERDQLRDPVDVAVRHAEDAADVAHDRLRGHRAVGDDLRDAVVAIAPAHVVDHAVPPFDAEIDVEVRHRHALGVQEPLEDQIVRERVEIGDAERVGGERADAGAAPGPHRDRVRARPRDEVGDDEEISLEAHLDDDVELAREPLAVAARVRLRNRELAQAFVETELGALLQIRTRRRAVVRCEVRQEDLAEVELEVAALRDLHRVRERLRQIREQHRHLLAGLEVLLLAIAPRARRVVERRTLTDADSRLVRLEVVALEETNVVGRDDRHGVRGR